MIPPLASGFVVGGHERPHLRAGWWERLEWPGRPGMIYRTAHPQAEFVLAERPGNRELHLLLAASLVLIGAPARVELLMSAGREAAQSLGTLTIKWEDWAVHRLPCSIPLSGPVTFTVLTHTPAIPDRVLHNGDHRALGEHLAAAALV